MIVNITEKGCVRHMNMQIKFAHIWTFYETVFLYGHVMFS